MEHQAAFTRDPEIKGVRVIHVITNAASEANGASVSAVRMCELLEMAGADVKLASLDEPGRPAQPSFALNFRSTPLLHPIASSGDLKRWLYSQARSEAATIFHSHGLWRMPNVYAGWAARGPRTRLIVSPHGALAEWALRKSRYRKKAFWALLQRQALGTATCFHATSEAEYDDIRRAGLKQPVCVLRHGVDLPPPNTIDRKRRVLFLGRVHAQKGMEILLHAWKAVEPAFPDWDLEIVGPGEPRHVRSFETLAVRLGIERAFFRGPLYGPRKLIALQEASLFVLPSFSESFGIAVAESLAAGTPVIVTKGTPWREVEGRGAGWWIDPGQGSLELALKSALSKPSAELEAMGNAGRRWMQSDFAWDDIGVQWAQTYRWLLERGAESRPPWIRLE